MISRLFAVLALISVSLLSFSGFGQTFTSSLDGNWNDGATWGNSSPGTQGVDYPSTGQNAVISSNVTIPSPYSATISNLSITAGYTLAVSNGGSLNLNAVLTLDDDGLGGVGFLDVSG